MTFKDFMTWFSETVPELQKALSDASESLAELLADDGDDENDEDEEDKKCNEYISKVADKYKKKADSLIERLDGMANGYDYLWLCSRLCDIDSLLENQSQKEEKGNTLAMLEKHINADEDDSDGIHEIIEDVQNSISKIDEIFYDMKVPFKIQSYIAKSDMALDDFGESVQHHSYTPEEIWLNNHGWENVLALSDHMYQSEVSCFFMERVLSAIKEENPPEKIVSIWSKVFYHHILPNKDEMEARKAFLRSDLYDDLEKAVGLLEERKADYKPLVKTSPYSAEKLAKVHHTLYSNGILSCELSHFVWLFNNGSRCPRDFSPINIDGNMAFLKKVIQELYGNTNMSSEFWNSLKPLFQVRGRGIGSIGGKTDKVNDKELEQVLKYIRSDLKE